MLICQDKKIKDIYYGGRKIKAAYLGNKKIFGRNSWKYAGGDPLFSPEACLLIDGKLLYCTPESCQVIEENVTDAVFDPRTPVFAESDKGWIVYFLGEDGFCSREQKSIVDRRIYAAADRILGVLSQKVINSNVTYFLLQTKGFLTYHCPDVSNTDTLVFEEQIIDWSYSDGYVFALTVSGRLFNLNYFIDYRTGAVDPETGAAPISFFHTLNPLQIAENVTSISKGHKGILYRNTAGEIWYWTSDSTNLLLTTQSENVKLLGSDFLIDGIIYRCPTDANGLLCSSEGGFDTTADGVSIKDGKLYNTTDLQNPVEIAGTPENVTELQGVVAKTSDNRFYLVLIDFSAVELITTSTE
ncbi:MAG: hypothetical protein IKA32_05880 [Lentisphaeria bacterium]|nr:hypothetical protein [Lentisphaeria bacterium]